MTGPATETDEANANQADNPRPARDSATRASLVHPLSVLIPAFVSIGLYLWRIGAPALWLDEGATWRDAAQPVGDLLAHLSERDAALGFYYLLMKAWITLGDSEGWLRMPSAFAMAGAVAITADLARRWWGPRSALAAGMLLAVAPVTSRYAQEARPYALVMLAAAASTWLLVRALDTSATTEAATASRTSGRAKLALLQRPPTAARSPAAGRHWWLGYAAAVTVLGLVHLLGLLTLVGHAVLVALSGQRWIRRRWAWTAGLGTLPCALLAGLAFSQRGYVAWIPEPTLTTLGEAYVYVVGHDDGVGFGALLAGLAMAGFAAYRVRRGGVELALLAAYAVPPLVLAGLGLLTPLFHARYLLPCGLALALLAGAALRRARVWQLGVVVGLAALLVWPQQTSMRAVDGHGIDARTAANALAGECRPGDAVRYDGGTVASVPYYLRDEPCELIVITSDVPDEARRIWAFHAPWQTPPSFEAAGFEHVQTRDELTSGVRLSLWARR